VAGRGICCGEAAAAAYDDGDGEINYYYYYYYCTLTWTPHVDGTILAADIIIVLCNKMYTILL